MNKINTIFNEIRDIREKRELSELPLRVMKLCEEAGEASGAIVSVVTNSYKGLTWEDALEEIIDTWIVASDAMFAPIPGTENMSEEDRCNFIASIMEKKMSKWKAKIAEGADNS